ncbi:YkgJ family cysteine cluster protein [Methanolobus halotolerans]|nr:YkgJ family cysteine cluster protein [Methanolobus halotolerans]
MSVKFKEYLIQSLREELETAKRTDPEELASKIHSIGFYCNMCGKCCRKEHGDNTVIVSPEEIERICGHTGFRHTQVSIPLTEGTDALPDINYLEDNRDLIDREGNIHTFGWKMCQQRNGDCTFIREKGSGNSCSIYEVRPMLCSTYPFYMQDGELNVSECEGLGKHISIEQSLELAGKVRSRYIAEIQETILLYEKYEGFEQGPENVNKAFENILEGIIKYIVHDSRGIHRTALRIKQIID